MVNDMKLVIIEECVQADITAMEQNYFDDIISKLKMVSSNRLETIFQMLNIGVVDMIILEEIKSKKKEKGLNNNSIIKIL